jgi:hypothetical protein
MPTVDTPDHDPRYDRAQTVDGAKARYVHSDDYTIQQLESDVDRILTEGENPDKKDIPHFGGQEVIG